ncbi:MAG: hypothetical protein EP303_01895, partial [Deltaproteobacteria bacterium]
MWYGPSSGRSSLTHPSVSDRRTHHTRLGPPLSAYSLFQRERNTWGSGSFLFIMQMSTRYGGTMGIVRKASRAKKSKDPLLGKVVAGRYRLESQLGEGGMGVVYRARHVLIDRVVALKLIRPDLRGETHLRAWMVREARAANRVDHAHIVDIHDVGETEEGELYLVMEYLIGDSLSSQIAKGP